MSLKFGFSAARLDHGTGELERASTSGLAAASPLTDKERRRMLASALDSPTQQKTSQEKAIDS